MLEKHEHASGSMSSECCFLVSPCTLLGIENTWYRIRTRVHEGIMLFIPDHYLTSTLCPSIGFKVQFSIQATWLCVFVCLFIQ